MVVEAQVKETIPVTSQIPGVKEMLVTFFEIPLLRDVALPDTNVALICSPIIPTDGAVPCVRPFIAPPVCVVTLLKWLVPVNMLPIETKLPAPVRTLVLLQLIVQLVNVRLFPTEIVEDDPEER